MPRKEPARAGKDTAQKQQSEKPASDPDIQAQTTSLFTACAMANQRSLSPRDALQLQRVIGNRAVGRLLAEGKGNLDLLARPLALMRSPINRKMPIQRLSKTLNMGKVTAQIIYSMGAAVKGSNNYQLGNETYQEMNTFTGTATIRLTLSGNMDEALPFGFIANVLSSTRTAYYDSSKRTKVTVSFTSQTLDGDGQEIPFAEPPQDAPTSAGAHTLDLEYSDSPLLMFPRKDPNAKNEGNKLVKVSGEDIHSIWLVVGDPTTGGLIVLDSKAFQIKWDTDINNDTNKAQVVGKAALTIKSVKPVLDGSLANEGGNESEDTW